MGNNNNGKSRFGYGYFNDRREITSVKKCDTGYEIECGSKGVFVDDDIDFVPRTGQIMTFYTETGNFFSPVMEADFETKDFIYHIVVNTPQKLKQKQLEREKMQIELKARQYEENKKWMDDTYNSFPPEFKKRIDRFRSNQKDWDVEYGYYEIICCQQALLFANTFKNKDEIKLFFELPYLQRFEVCPGYSDFHSGNSFGFSCFLAIMWLENPEKVVNARGALTIIVGADEYGDLPHKEVLQ